MKVQSVNQNYEQRKLGFGSLVIRKPRILYKEDEIKAKVLDALAGDLLALSKPEGGPERHILVDAACECFGIPYAAKITVSPSRGFLSRWLLGKSETVTLMRDKILATAERLVARFEPLKTIEYNLGECKIIPRTGGHGPQLLN